MTSLETNFGHKKPKVKNYPGYNKFSASHQDKSKAEAIKFEPIAKEKAPQTGNVDTLRGKFKDKALKALSQQVVGKSKINLENPEDVKKTLSWIAKTLKDSKIQKGLNYAVESLDQGETLSRYMASIRRKWDKLSPKQQFACVYAPAVPSLLLFNFLVKTGLLTYKRAPTRADIEEVGRMTDPLIRAGVKVWALFDDDIKKIEFAVEPFLAAVNAYDDLLLNAYDHLQEVRKKGPKKSK